MSYEPFNNPAHVKHLDDVMNELSKVSSLYASARNSNVRKEIKEEFVKLSNKLSQEKWTYLKPEFKK